MTASAPVPVRHVVWFFVLPFAISWLAWSPTVLDSTGVLDLPDPVGILGIVGPFADGSDARGLIDRATRAR